MVNIWSLFVRQNTNFFEENVGLSGLEVGLKMASAVEIGNEGGSYVSRKGCQMSS